MPHTLNEGDTISLGSPYLDVGQLKQPNPCQYTLHPANLQPVPTAAAAAQMAHRGQVFDLTEVLFLPGSARL